MDIQSRVVTYYKNNSFIQKYLKGIDANTNEVVLDFNGESKKVSIDLLETFKNETDLINNINGVKETISNNVEAVSITPVSKEQAMLTPDTNIKKETLNDVKILVELKNKEGLDNLLKKFAVNPNTGLIDVNQAISKVTRNTMNEVEKAIKNNYEFDTDMLNYDIEGNYIGTPIESTTSDDEKIVRSFNNIKVFLDVCKMYPEQANYNEDQINNFMKTYMKKVKEELYGSNNQKVSAPTNKQEVPVEPVKVNASAGFADIFVLTVIVLVYAVIIVNLILKLK